MQAYQDTFEKLNSARQTKPVKREFVAPFLWSKIPAEKKSVNGTCEVWSLTDALSTVKDLETKDYQSSSTIGNILRKYAPTDMLPAQKFELTNNHLNIIDVTDKKMTAEISRYAAWAIMKEIGNHYNTTFQQEYFLAPNPNFEQIISHVNELSRIDAREKVKTYTHNLNGIIGSLINQNYQFGKFYILLYNWLFPREYNSTNNNLPNYSHITDYMNYKLLPLYANALESIVNRYNGLRNKTYDNLYTISRQEMLSIRKHFIEAQDSTKKNISFVSIKDVIADRKKREQAFVNKYIYEKIR